MRLAKSDEFRQHLQVPDSTLENLVKEWLGLYDMSAACYSPVSVYQRK